MYKQFNIHNKTGMRINEKHNVRVEKSYGQLNENKIVPTCVCVCSRKKLKFLFGT